MAEPSEPESSSPTSIAFLAAPAVRGATVAVLGRLTTALCQHLRQATAPTGMVVACAPVIAARSAGCAAVRADPAYGLPLLSHSVDLALLLEVPDEGSGRLVAELRRVLAPGGRLRAVTTPPLAYRLVGELHAAGFLDVEAVRVDSLAGVRAAAPR